MVRFDDHVARDDLRIGEDLSVVVDRSARDVVSVEEREPVAARLRGHDALDQGGELGRLRTRLRLSANSGSVGPLGMTEHAHSCRNSRSLSAPIVT